jgi:hypothetical protein
MASISAQQHEERRLHERRVRETRLKSKLTAAMFGGGDSAMAHLLDQLEDLDDAITFFAHEWKHGSILELEPGQKTDRWGSTVRLNARWDRDPQLYTEMRRYPTRYLGALLTQEATGLPIMNFLGEVQEVRFVEEEPGVHWLLLAECHHGCDVVGPAVAAEPSSGSCSVCGRPQGAACGGEQTVAATALERIHAVDDYLERLASTDKSARERLAKNPTEAFAQATQKLFGGTPEELFGIREVRVAVDSEVMIYFVRLAKHEPMRPSLVASTAATAAVA